ncbi:MAG: hypothetical protein ACK5PS_05430 [Desulfopila sp.]
MKLLPSWGYYVPVVCATEDVVDLGLFFLQTHRRRKRENNIVQKGDHTMSNQHCPGFEANKTLSEVKVKCPDCAKEFDVFSDEMESKVKCPACGSRFDPKNCTVDSVG